MHLLSCYHIIRIPHYFIVRSVNYKYLHQIMYISRRLQGQYIYIYIYIYIYYIYNLVKLATLVEGDPKAPFSIATTPMCWGVRYSVPWIAPLYPWSLPYNAGCKARQHQVSFLSLWYDLNWDWISVSRTIGNIYVYICASTWSKWVSK